MSPHTNSGTRVHLELLEVGRLHHGLYTYGFGNTVLISCEGKERGPRLFSTSSRVYTHHTSHITHQRRLRHTHEQPPPPPLSLPWPLPRPPPLCYRHPRTTGTSLGACARHPRGGGGRVRPRSCLRCPRALGRSPSKGLGVGLGIGVNVRG